MPSEEVSVGDQPEDPDLETSSFYPPPPFRPKNVKKGLLEKKADTCTSF